MAEQNRKTLKRTDLILIAVLLLLCGGIYFFFQIKKTASVSKENYAVLVINDTISAIFPLEEHHEHAVIALDEYGFPGKAEFQDGKVRLIEADCPDKVCESIGYVSQEFESIVCLPNRAAILIYTPEEFEALNISKQ